MDAQDIRNLQEAYLDVYSSTEEIDEATATPPSKFNIRQGLDAISRRLRRSSDFYAYGKDPDPEERKISTSKGEGGITKNPKKLRKQKALGEIGEQVDLYDIILSHLLDEGYAETPEAAEAIMVNMSEDWRESIVEEVLEEGKKEFPETKVREKAAKHEEDYIKKRNPKSMRLARKMKGIASTVEVGDDPRNTMHGQDLRKIR